LDLLIQNPHRYFSSLLPQGTGPLVIQITVLSDYRAFFPAPKLFPAPVGTAQYNDSSVNERPTITTPHGDYYAKTPAASGDLTPSWQVF